MVVVVVQAICVNMQFLEFREFPQIILQSLHYSIKTTGKHGSVSNLSSSIYKQTYSITHSANKY